MIAVRLSLMKFVVPLAFLLSTVGPAVAADWPPLTPRAQAKLTATTYPIDVADPLEGLNRRIYVFNAKFDRYLFLPVTDFYKAAVPSVVRDCVTNFLSNLGEITNFGNSILQLKGGSAATAAGRFLTNSVFGLGGTFDVAGHVGLVEAPEDFGQTLAVYGVPDGAYLMLPLLGPSNLRDTSGLVVDAVAFSLIDPLNFDDHAERQWIYTGATAIDTRANVAFRYFQTGSPFEYELVRFLYTTKRQLDAAR